MAKSASYEAHLYVNGEEWPITDADYEEPEAALGASLRVTLADPSLGLPENPVIDFEVVITIAGQSSSFYFVEGGRILGHEARITADGDELKLTTVNQLTKLLGRTPRIPLIYYDPAKVRFGDESTSSKTDVLDEQRRPIEIIKKAVPDLNLRQALDLTFIEHLDFAQVVTNIEDYDVRRVDFPLQSSFYNASKPLTDLFEPAVFADDDMTVWVIDLDGQMPTGLASQARRLRASQYIEVTAQRPVTSLVNACLLTYRIDTTGSDEFPPNATDRIDAPQPVEAFNPNLPSQSFTSQVITHYKDFHDNEEDPSEVTRSVPWKVEHRTWTRDRGGIQLELEHIIQTDFYTRNFLLQTGFDKSVSRRLVIPGSGQSSPFLVRTLEERKRIEWLDSLHNPDVQIKLYDRQWTEGLVVTEGAIVDVQQSGEAVIEAVTKQPLTESNLNRNIQHDSLQTVQWEPIHTRQEHWRDTGTNQVNVQITEIDELIPQAQAETTVAAIADREVNVRELATETILIRNLESEAENEPQPPIQIDAGEVPYSIAVKVARRRMERGGSKPNSRTFVLNHFDSAIHRGSVRVIEDRAGNGQLFLITHQTVSFRFASREEMDIIQSAGGFIARYA